MVFQCFPAVDCIKVCPVCNKSRIAIDVCYNYNGKIMCINCFTNAHKLKGGSKRKDGKRKYR